MPKSMELPRLLHAISRVLLAVLGAPDYERYLAHMRSCHPDSQALSARDFAREQLERRYARAGARCC